MHTRTHAHTHTHTQTAFTPQSHVESIINTVILSGDEKINACFMLWEVIETFWRVHTEIDGKRTAMFDESLNQLLVDMQIHLPFGRGEGWNLDCLRLVTHTHDCSCFFCLECQIKEEKVCILSCVCVCVCLCVCVCMKPKAFVFF